MSLVALPGTVGAHGAPDPGSSLFTALRCQAALSTQKTNPAAGHTTSIQITSPSWHRCFECPTGISTKMHRAAQSVHFTMTAAVADERPCCLFAATDQGCSLLPGL